MGTLQCFKCGATLTKQDVCLQCGEDMRLYKRILFNADQLYNLGLERAKAGDLSGARNYLRQCIQLNKNHVTARNLLGLVYYRLGEPALALREWIFSTHLQPDDNLASRYLRSVEKSLSHINGSVSRYNMAVTYLQHNSRDLAIVQLKQLMGRPYQILRAQQLMALLYMQDGQYSKALKLLKLCQKTDKGNPITKRYIRALEERRRADEDGSYRRAMTEAVENRTDSDVIIPHNTREYGSYFMYVLYILIGLILGIGMVYFIAVPAVRNKEQENNRQELLSYEQAMSDWQNQVVKEQANVDRLTAQADELKEKIQAYEGTGDGLTYDVFLPILNAYAANDISGIEDEFYKLDQNKTNEDYRQIYLMLQADVRKNLGERAYYRGMQFLDKGEYQNALDLFEVSRKHNGYNVKNVFQIGVCHQLLDHTEWALYYYQYAAVTWPDDPWSANPKARLNAMLEADPSLTVPAVTPGELGEGKEERPDFVEMTEEETTPEETDEEASSADTIDITPSESPEETTETPVEETTEAPAETPEETTEAPAETTEAPAETPEEVAPAEPQEPPIEDEQG